MQIEENRYGDLGKPIEDVREMAQVLAQGQAAPCGIRQGRLGPSLFAVYHLAELANTLHTQYDGVEVTAA